MKRHLVPFAALFVAALPALSHAAPRGEAKLAVAGKSIAVDYGRPSLEGRDMIAKAEVGKPWRMGADAATTFTTQADLAFGGVKVAKGEYVLQAVKQAEDKWNLLFRQNGATVAETPLTLSQIDASVEMLTIELKPAKDGGEFVLSWGRAALRAAFSAK